MAYRNPYRTSEFSGIFDSIKKAFTPDIGQRQIKVAASQTSAAAEEAQKTLIEAQGAIKQGRDVLAVAGRVAEDMESYVKRIQNIPIEELARRFDYKTKLAVEELLSLSSFMKKSLIYLAGMATLSIYLNILTRK